MKFWEDIVVGEAAVLGRHIFTAESIKAFARRFDPHPFHLDEAPRRARISARSAPRGGTPPPSGCG
jgi:acyl dehydratase